ncbi:MAG: Ig-like domain repeat protein [Planctomycetes bacterium]|nr:Ig-like domain repeat protein [Planctomycetota bacterium]
MSVLLNTTPQITGSPAIGTIQDDDAPVTVASVTGTTPQHATVNTPFATNLAVTVKNAAGEPVSNVSVTFAAPASGASGTFGASATVLTDSSGIATAPTLTANGTSGSYTVTATAEGGTNPLASFDLTNEARLAVVTVTNGGTYDGNAHHAISNAVGTDGVTPISGTFDYTYYGSDGSTVLTGAPTNAGNYYVTAIFTSSDNNYEGASSPKTPFSIGRVALTYTIADQSQTYGSPATLNNPSILTGVGSETIYVSESSTGDTATANVGTYDITGVAADGTGLASNYDLAITNGTLTVEKANAAFTVSRYTLTYDGSPHSATYTTITGVNGETGDLVGTIDVSHTLHTNAGTYDSDFWTFTGGTNYNDIASQTISDQIDKADATFTVTPYSVTYDGTAHAATVTTITGVNGETGAAVGSVTLNTTHTNAGTYASDSWSFAGTANYNDIASQAISDQIDKADATFTVTPYGTTYDGSSHTATVTTITGVNGETGATVGVVDLSGTMHTNAGSYANDSWSFTGTGNYNDIAATTISDFIDKADATFTVTPYGTTYDGNSHTATVTTITGVNGETGATVGVVDLSGTTHTNAGSYANDSWSFTGTGNYNDIAATTISDQIDKADATFTVTSYGATYDGISHTATVSTITGVNGETGDLVGTVDVSNTVHTNAGTYANDSWSFTGGGNYNDIAATTISDQIDKANATFSVTPYNVIYDGLPHAAVVSIVLGMNGESGAIVGSVSLNTTHTNAGTYASDTWSFTGGANYNSIASQTISDSIGKASATIIIAPYNVNYDGNPHTATIVSIAGANGETGASVGSVNVSSTTHTNPGNYSSDTWTFTGTANYNNISATTIVDKINNPTTTSVASSLNPSTYGQSVTFTATISSTATPTGSVSFVIDNGSPITGSIGATTSTTAKWTYTTSALNAGSHTVSAIYVHSGLFADSNGSLPGGQVVNKANAVVVVTPYTVTYNGLAHSATVASITGVNGQTGASVGTVTLNTTHTNAGTYTSDSWSFTGTSNYNNIASTAITDIINKAAAKVVVAPYTVTYDGLAHTATVTSITGVNGETGATVGTVNVSNTTHTNAGTYAADSWSFTGGANYNNIASTTISDKVNKATAKVVVTPYNLTYDGGAHTATVTSITGVNGETGATVGAVTLNTTHTNAGTYTTDTWSFTGAANYNNIASTAITDKVSKANAIVVVTPYNLTYDGSAHTATVTSITGVNGETGGTVGTVTVTNTTHTNAGTFAFDSWTFTGTANYNNIAATTITDKINKANAQVVVTPYNLTYDGAAHTATVTSITGVAGQTGATVGTVNVATTSHTNAGTYATDSWTFTGTANYNSIAATTITDTINKANATVIVTPYSAPYNGVAHKATVTSITGVAGQTGATVGTVNLNNTTHTSVGLYASDSWSFTGGANYNSIANTTITDSISPVVTAKTTSLAANAVSLVIQGNGFDLTPANNTVVFNNGAVGTVTTATLTSLTVTFSTGPLTAGSLTALVTTNSQSNGAAVQVATIIPVVTKNTASLSANADTITIAGFGFDLTPGNNTIVFSNGAVGIVTASTATSLTVTFTTKPTLLGILTALITTNGLSSSVAVQVATVV